MQVQRWRRRVDITREELMVAARGEGERRARADVVVVVKVVLPVVPQPKGRREPGADTNLILHEAADDLLQERDVAVTDLLNERVRTAGRVRVEAGEVEGAP